MKRFAVMLAASALFPAALFGATCSDYLNIVESAVENLVENLGWDPKKSYNFVCESGYFVNYCSFGGV